MRTVLMSTLVAALALGGAVWAQTQKGNASAMTVEVYKSPTCGCCAKWVEHMKAAGFTTRVTDMPDEELQRLKTKSGIPMDARSCHTALVGGYALEGHVPAADVKRLLSEKPTTVGIAVPGMPVGSPGMEIPSGQVQPYKVVAIDKTGKTTVFASHDK